MSVIDPKKYFCWGGDYKIPVFYGLMEKETIRDAKISPTFSADIFAREFCSKWTGTIEGALFNLDKLSRLRRLKRPEFKPNYTHHKNAFYVLSVDVGRKRDKSAFEIFKVIPKEDHFEKHLVNILIFNKMSLTAQAKRIRDLDETFNFEMIAVDVNGLGIGLLDNLVEDYTDQVSGKTYSGYNIINIEEHKDYKSFQKPNKPTKLYPIITNQHSAGKIHILCYNELMKTHVKFLIDETIAKTKLMNTEKVKSMSLAERMEYLSPYKNTSQLIQETTNLKPAEKETQFFKLEYISSGRKDTFSALEYGLWAISKREEVYYRNLKSQKRDIRRMLMFN